MSALGARLEVIAGKAAGMSILIEDELVIGRQAGGAGRLAEDQELSRKHARIALAPDGTYTIEDLGSTNGTFVNGTRVHGPRILIIGDTIGFGATTVVARELTPPPRRAALNDEDAPSSRKGSQVATVPAAPEKVGDIAPSTDRTSQDVAPPAPLALLLEVDFASQEARVTIEGTTDMRLHFEDGDWRVATASKPPTS